MTDDEGHAIGYKVLPKGTPVVTADGVTLGSVAKVMDNEREHIFDGIVVRLNSPPPTRVFVDAPEVERIAERRVTLNVDASTEFEPYRGWRGRVEYRARRRANRLKRNLGR